MPKRLLACLCSLFILVALSFVPDEADAARIGGGRSFGGRPSMSTPYNKPMTNPSSPTMRQQANQAGQPGAAAAAPGRGMFGGMGGMFGGLLAGGLIGSLLFGGGMGGAGGMGGMLDIILIAALIYFGFKFFARRRAATQAAGAAASPAGAFGYQGDYRGDQRDTTMQRDATPPAGKGGFDWSALSSSSSPAAADMFNGQPSDTNAGIHLPGGFDEEEFLRGAKAAYTRLNAAWDRRDVDDIALFSSPTFLAEIRKQKETDPSPSKTEIMLVNSASILEGKVEDGEQIVSVYFDVLLREDPSQETPVNVREVWHFTRPADGNGSWKLDGIQQVERA